MKNPRVCLLKTDGINCDEELKFAFELAKADPKIVHINELRQKKDYLKNYQILALPGGFSYGDDVASGKILAIELSSYLADQINDFVNQRQGLVLGICNGFQVLVKTGLLPSGRLGKMKATLTDNDCRHFVCRPINLTVEKKHRCLFLKNFTSPVTFYVAHGEGKFVAPRKELEEIEKNNLVVFRYADLNPNGSLHNIAGITDLSGRILGLMPHPERSILKTQSVNWRRNTRIKPEGLELFKQMVNYARQQ
ncbi:MAG TPA: phosphoribosylformylglycinamidine synthase I [Candidatus Woesebacteria bacterium]|nr:phosphoribosylformylglycinamidine synthase I [Candidatus Woesebacteria bacterium]